MIPPIAVNFLNLQLGLANAKNHDSPPMAKMLIIPRVSNQVWSCFPRQATTVHTPTV